jgi:hypothetical protein
VWRVTPYFAFVCVCVCVCVHWPPPAGSSSSCRRRPLTSDKEEARVSAPHARAVGAHADVVHGCGRLDVREGGAVDAAPELNDRAVGRADEGHAEARRAAVEANCVHGRPVLVLLSDGGAQ